MTLTHLLKLCSTYEINNTVIKIYQKDLAKYGKNNDLQTELNSFIAENQDILRQLNEIGIDTKS